MAYNKQQAHEYYINYVKKGKKKGRQKAKTTKKSKKKSATTKLLALSSSGLNENGKIELAFMKEKLTNEMNSALSKAKTAEEKENIRREYQKKAVQAVNDLKANKDYAAEKKTSTKGSSSKSGGSSKSGSSKSSSSKSSSGKSSGASKSSSSSNTSSNTTVKQVSAALEKIQSQLSSYSPEKKAELRGVVNSLLSALRGNNTNQISALLKQFGEVVKGS